MTSRRGRLAGCLTHLALVCGGLVVALLAAEGLVRLTFGNPPDLLDKSDPVLGVRYVRDLTAERRVDGRRVPVTINHEGFHSPEYAPVPPPGTHRLVFLGDSFTGATEVPLAQTWHQRLATTLTARLGVPVQSVNLGVSGYGTAQEWLCYRTVGRRYACDGVVLAVFVGNDISDNERGLPSQGLPMFDFDARGGLVELPFRPHYSKRNGWLRGSALYKLQKQVTNQVIANHEKSAGVLPRYGVYGAPTTPVWRHAWAITEALLLALRDDVKADGHPLCVMLIPEELQVDPRAFAALVKQYPALGRRTWDLGYPQRRLTAFCRANGIPVVDLQGAFRLASAHQRLYNREDPHFNAAGHAVAGEVLAQALEGLRWLSAAPGDSAVHGGARTSVH